MSWIEAIFNKLSELWPFQRIQPWEKGIQTYFIPLRGIRVFVREPGVHFVPWYFSEIHIESVVPQGVLIPEQTVLTSDGIAITFTASIIYEVRDVLKNITKVHAFVPSLVDLAKIYLASRIRRTNYKALVETMPTIEKRLRRTISRVAAEWGVTILKIGITDFAISKQFRLYGMKEGEYIDRQR